MNVYVWIKVVHVISSTILFGTGIGIAFFKWVADRSGNVSAIRVVSEQVVVADTWFTTPAIVVQAVTGIALARIAGFQLLSGWLLCAIGLYLLAGACWLPVVYLQVRMRGLARCAERDGTPLTSEYYRAARQWFWLGLPAFSSLLIVFWLMVAKPF